MHVVDGSDDNMETTNTVCEKSKVYLRTGGEGPGGKTVIKLLFL
jgi:hypothetical protein